MEIQREKELVELLNKYDLSGTSFNDARQKILAQGFTEAELVYGLYSAPFDGKVNEPRPANPLQKFYEQNPDKADKVAKNLLLVQAQMDWDKTAAYAAASQFAPDTQSKSYYEVRTADELGIPYFTLMFLGVVFVIVAIKLKLTKETTDTLLLVFSFAVNALFIFKIVQKRRSLNKLRKDSRSDKN